MLARVYAWRTLGVEGDEAVTQRPFVHGLVEDGILWEDDHSDVLKPAQPLQDLGHWLWFGLLHHAAYPHHDLSLWGLNEGEEEQPVNGLSEERPQQIRPVFYPNFQSLLQGM